MPHGDDVLSASSTWSHAPDYTPHDGPALPFVYLLGFLCCDFKVFIIIMLIPSSFIHVKKLLEEIINIVIPFP